MLSDTKQRHYDDSCGDTLEIYHQATGNSIFQQCVTISIHGISRNSEIYYFYLWKLNSFTNKSDVSINHADSVAESLTTASLDLFVATAVLWASRAGWRYYFNTDVNYSKTGCLAKLKKSSLNVYYTMSVEKRNDINGSSVEDRNIRRFSLLYSW